VCFSALHLCFFSISLRPAGQFASSLRLLLAAGSLAWRLRAATAQRLASANSKEYFPSSIYGAASPRVVAMGTGAARWRFVSGRQPYTIAGQTYYPSEKHYAATGLASWYGDAFHGRRTANGEVYDRDSISAAHPTMPCQVTHGHQSAQQLLDDRACQRSRSVCRNRIMDVSRKTAEALDFRQTGTTRVKVEYIGAASLEDRMT